MILSTFRYVTLYTVSQKKCAPFISTVTLANVVGMETKVYTDIVCIEVCIINQLCFFLYKLVKSCIKLKCIQTVKLICKLGYTVDVV